MLSLLVAQKNRTELIVNVIVIKIMKGNKEEKKLKRTVGTRRNKG